MTTIEQWNNAAAVYTENQEKSAFVALNKRMVAERFPELLGKIVLDLGCGYGVYTDYFAGVGATATGCDGSAEMLRLARSRYPLLQFHQADLLQPLPYEDAAFDLVFCNQVLMDIDPIEPLLKEVARITKPGAYSTCPSYIRHFSMRIGDRMKTDSGIRRSWIATCPSIISTIRSGVARATTTAP